MNAAAARLHPALQIILRTLAVIAGLAAGLFVLVIYGFAFSFNGCSSYSEHATSMLCTTFEGFVPYLQIAVAVVGGLAPLAGGVSTCVSGRARWLIGGMAIAACMIAAVLALTSAMISTGSWN